MPTPDQNKSGLQTYRNLKNQDMSNMVYVPNDVNNALNAYQADQTLSNRNNAYQAWAKNNKDAAYDAVGTLGNTYDSFANGLLNSYKTDNDELMRNAVFRKRNGAVRELPQKQTQGDDARSGIAASASGNAMTDAVGGNIPGMDILRR